jgi:hypothetical protein
MVAVDATVRKETLRKLKQLKNKCLNMPSLVPVLMDVSALENYGLDDSYNRVSEKSLSSFTIRVQSLNVSPGQRWMGG